MKNKIFVLTIAITVLTAFAAAPSAEALVFLAPAAAVAAWAAAVVTTGLFAAADSQKEPSRAAAVDPSALMLSKNTLEYDLEAEE